MADCNTCHRFGQWWEWQEISAVTGRPIRVLRRSFCAVRPLQVPAYAVHHICTECIGGIASCCDGAGAAQPEPRRLSDAT